MFVVKDAVPDLLCSLVARHFPTRVRQHLFSDRNSPIYRDSESCGDLCSEACLSISESALTVFQLKIKKVLHTERKRPSPNKPAAQFKLNTFVVILHSPFVGIYLVII